MSTIKKCIYLFYTAIFIVISDPYISSAQVPTQTAKYFNGPTVSDITSTGARINLSKEVLSDWTNLSDTNNLYFEYYRTNQVCIAIYPTPTECLPKKTTPGLTSIQLTDLIPNTSYTIVYKKDNTIRCITTPCPDNGFISLEVEFKTLPTNIGSNNDPELFTKSFGFRARGAEVTRLQNILIQRGFMRGISTGYFGVATRSAVQELQKSYGITTTGYFGPQTRLALSGKDVTNTQEEKFSGRVTAVSTGCFADGECSITVDGKKVVITIGWSQEVVGSVVGSSLGDVPVGALAKVYAKKTLNGYTLYGNSKYYVEIDNLK